MNRKHEGDSPFNFLVIDKNLRKVFGNFYYHQPPLFLPAY